jgi:hypothetical protein
MFCSVCLLLPAMLFDQLSERISARFIQYGAEVRVSPKVRQKIVAVGFSQGIDARISVLAVDFAVLIAMPSVQAGLFHSPDFSTRESNSRPPRHSGVSCPYASFASPLGAKVPL